MGELQAYDLASPSGRQEFQRWIVELARNEINSYTKQAQNAILVGTQAGGGLSGTYPNPTVFLSGMIMPFAGAAAPASWLLCDGAAVSRSTYSALFVVLASTYGAGDGSTTFNVPNMAGRVPVGAGAGAQQGASGSGVITGGTALTTRTRGEFYGDERLQAHTHTGTTGTESADHSHSGTTGYGRNAGGPTNLLIAGNAGSYVYETYNQIGNTNTSQRHLHDFSTGGRSAAHTHGFTSDAHNQSQGAQQNLPPGIVTNYIIKT